MELRPNRVKQKLDRGEPAFVGGMFTHADDIDSFGPVGFDGIWLEGEHGGVDAADLGNLTRACDIWGMTSVVRVNRTYLEFLRVGVVTDTTLRRLSSLYVLFVCTGNTCRSPMAEAMAKKLVADRLGTSVDKIGDFGFEISSMGVFAGVGSPASTHAVEAMREKGLDLEHHSSRAAMAEDLESFDRIYCLTASHLEALRMRVPPGKDRNLVLLDPEGSGIGDPIGGNLDDYRRCAETIYEKLLLHVDEWA